MTSNLELNRLLTLTFLKGIGPILAKSLIQRFGCAEAVFEAKEHELLNIDGLGPTHISVIKQVTESLILRAEAEIDYCKKHNIDIIPFSSADYPIRLKQLIDSPLLIYVKGKAQLNHPRTVSIVGTRKPTAQSLQMVQQIVEQLQTCGIQIISGMAYGIDIQAHKSAVSNNLETIGVMAHGLDIIYPSNHASTVGEMLKSQGSIISEMPIKTALHPDLFPRRNRIVAGMSDALIVVESKLTGGSMATAHIAHSYDREVFAIPSHPYKSPENGCNALIKRNIAHLIEDGMDLIRCMKWSHALKEVPTKQIELFPNLNEDEKNLLHILTGKKLHIDELLNYSDLPLHRLTLALLELELKGILQVLPGKYYQRIS
jgi:DNA processing protein